MNHDGPVARLSLSHLSYELLDQCQRRWILNYACDHLPPALKWPAKQQKKLTLWPWFIGSVVDATISQALLRYKQERQWPADMEQRAHRTMCHWWQHSLEWTHSVRNHLNWPSGNGYQPIDRHYYSEPILKQDWEKAKARIFQCINSFMASPLPAFITSFPTAHWRGPRALTEFAPKYQLGPVPVWAAYDFTIQTLDLTYIFDWKSGEPSEHSRRRARQQLLWYALYVVQEWKVPVENVRLCPVWLRPSVDWRTGEVTPEELERLADEIHHRYEHLSARLMANGGASISLEEWPLTDNLRECSRCPFRGVCDGSRRMPAPASSIPTGHRRARAPLASTVG